MSFGITAESPFTYRAELRPDTHVEFRFTLEAAHFGHLAEKIVSALEGHEVLLRLPTGEMGSWVIYWRIREGDNRALSAHPDKDEWVATVSLERPVFETMIRKLRAGEAFSLESLCTLGGFSNFHLEFQGLAK